MAHLLGSSTNQYDVLGLAPDASPDEIDAAFDWLIRRKNYRYDVPLHQWPQRLREIRAAYATLRDPVKRRAYDTSLRQATESLGWSPAASAESAEAPAAPPKPRQPAKRAASGSIIAAAGDDAGTDSLVLAKARPPRKRAASKRAKSAAIPTGAVALAAASGAKTEATEPVRPPKAPRRSPRPASPVSTDRAAANEVERQQASTAPPELGRAPDQEAPSPALGSPPDGVAEPAAQQGEWVGARGWSSHRTRRRGIKTWGVPAVVTLGLATVLIGSWPTVKSQLSGSGGTAAVPATVERVSVAGSVTPPPASVDNGPAAAAGLTPDELAAAAADAAGASASLRQWLGPDGQANSETAVPDDKGLPSGPVTEEQPAAAAPPSETAAEKPDAPAPPVAPEAARPVPAPAQTVPSAAPASQEAASAAQTQPAARAAASQASLSSPAKWISGGPVDADNRGRRYKGSVAVRFTVGTEGGISNCTTLRTSGNRKLDALTCRILAERARFTPARDAQGRSVESEVRAVYVWGRGRRPKN